MVFSLETADDSLPETDSNYELGQRPIQQNVQEQQQSQTMLSLVFR